MPETVALVVAAGRGHRFGGSLPKQYAPLGGSLVLHHTLATFARHPAVDAVRAVIHPDDRTLFDQAAADLDLLEPIPGGSARQDSVRLGLESLEALAPAKVLIHDGARPFVSQDLVSRVIDALDHAPGALAAVPVTDTLKREAESGRQVAKTIDRTGLWRAQTPQGFHFGKILAAHRAASGAELTDDAAVAEQAGIAVSLVEGSAENEKITTPEDLQRAEARMTARLETRFGQGFDVHRFGPAGSGSGKIHLCGLGIAHDCPLIGHSDADVALHALTDALLGALAAGDIGDHFPPTDPQWKGAPSHLFLEHARDLVSQRGGKIVNVDLTLICERPKIGPHRQAMAARVAELLGVSLGRVSIKATTTEGLGFTGRREGIAVQAAAALRLPSDT